MRIHIPRPTFLSIFAAAAIVATLLTTASAASQNASAPDIHPDIHYVPTPDAVVDAMLNVVRVTANDVVYDLGSGDGRIPIEAARRFGARGIGIELDPALVKRARDRARKAGVEDKVRFIEGDLFKTDLSEATVVTLYLSPSINLRLRSKLQRELKPGSRVVSHRFPIADWPPDQELMVGRNRVLFWMIR